MKDNVMFSVKIPLVANRDGVISSVDVTFTDTIVPTLYSIDVVSTTQQSIEVWQGNGRSSDVITYTVSKDNTITFGTTNDDATVLSVRINSMMVLELVVLLRDGDVNVFAKLTNRGSVALKALYRGTKPPMIKIDKITNVILRRSTWRIPNSRLA